MAGFRARIRPRRRWIPDEHPSTRALSSNWPDDRAHFERGGGESQSRCVCTYGPAFSTPKCRWNLYESAGHGEPHAVPGSSSRRPPRRPRPLRRIGVSIGVLILVAAVAGPFLLVVPGPSRRRHRSGRLAQRQRPRPMVDSLGMGVPSIPTRQLPMWVSGGISGVRVAGQR